MRLDEPAETLFNRTIPPLLLSHSSHPSKQEMNMMRQLLTVAALAAGGYALAKTLNNRSGSGKTSTVKESIRVNVPIRTAYNQWTQFENFPQFMSSVQQVQQLGDTRLHWRATVAGVEKEWDAEITEQIPDKRIAWRSVSGAPNEGVVTFEEISDGVTRVTLSMTYMPETTAEEVGDAFGAVKLQTKENLNKFKQLLESRGSETGAWRGTVHQH
jgi:uncharacterized membrane protein